MTVMSHVTVISKGKDENGATRINEDEEYFYCDGELHREDGPAVVKHHYGFHRTEEYYYRHGKLDRENGPAVIKHDALLRTTEEEYYRNGKLDRKNGPAVVKQNADGSIEEEYYRDGGLHRKNGPQIVKRYADGSTEERYCEDGEDRQHKGFLHRFDGPAYIKRRVDGSIEEERYYYGGVPRDLKFGPAVITHNADGSTVKEYCQYGTTVKTEYLNNEGAVVKTEGLTSGEQCGQKPTSPSVCSGPNRYAELKKATPQIEIASAPRAPQKPRAPGMAR